MEEKLGEELTTDGTQLKWRFAVDTRFVDKYHNLRPDSLMGFNQEAGERALAAAGLNYEQLREKGVIFVLAYVTIELKREIKLFEKIDLHTWHRESKGALFYRDTTYRGADGELAAAVRIACCALEPQSHKILRAEEVNALGISAARDISPLGGRFDRIKPIECGEPVGEYTMRWGDIDVNGHVNNTSYITLLMDFLPPEYEHRPLRRLSLQYRKECVRGESVRVCREVSSEEIRLSLIGADGQERLRASVRFE